MTKRFTNSTVYLVQREHTYAVTLTRINNDVNGNPRYKAEFFDTHYLASDGLACVIHYTFTGHYMSELKEAEWIVDYHINQE